MPTETYHPMPMLLLFQMKLRQSQDWGPWIDGPQDKWTEYPEEIEEFLKTMILPQIKKQLDLLWAFAEEEEWTTRNRGDSAPQPCTMLNWLWEPYILDKKEVSKSATLPTFYRYMR